MDLMTITPQHRDYRPYTKTGVYRTKLTAAQLTLLEQAGHGGIIRPVDGISWTSLRSMADKGAVEVIERVVRPGPRGPISGRILAVRVR